MAGLSDSINYPKTAEMRNGEALADIQLWIKSNQIPTTVRAHVHYGAVLSLNSNADFAKLYI